MSSVGVIIPAAGRGTRLLPLTERAPKELLPLGGQPLLAAALLELEAAGVEEAVVVVPPGVEEPRRRWVAANAPAGLSLAFAVQPAAAGVFDAVARGRRLLRAPRCCVLYPDYLHLPDQTGLGHLIAAALAGDPESSWFAVYPRDAREAERKGRTVHLQAAVLGGGAFRIDRVRVGAAVGAVQRPGALHTTFAEIRGAAHERLVASGPAEDGRLVPVLDELARRGLLFGQQLPGEILDVGVMAGYRDAAARFAAGTARWRRLCV